MTAATPFKSGFVGLIGRPNVGKSTLLNQVLGQKIAITSNKPQTTRNKIQGIYSTDEMQAIFLDTPGIHKPKHKLGQYMSLSAQSVMGDVDILFYLVDATAEIGGGEKYISQQLVGSKCPVFLVINKIDLLEKPQLLAVIDKYKELGDFAEVVPVAAKTGENVEVLLETLKKYLPEGPLYYPLDTVTDQPEQVIIAEIIREKILQATTEEIPHAIAVNITEMEERENGLIYIAADIYVERESQKGIIIGKKGVMLQKIGSAARLEVEGIFASKVFLALRVKMKKGWRNNDTMLKNFGFDKKEL